MGEFCRFPPPARRYASAPNLFEQMGIRVRSTALLALTTALASVFFAAPAAQASVPAGPVRIVGGTSVDDSIMANSWMAKVRTPAKDCSGTLIAKDWVLTGTSCLTGDPTRGGPTTVTGPDDRVSAAGQTRKTTWAASRGGLTLVRLDKPIEVGGYIPLAYQNAPIGSRTTFFGAGIDCFNCRLVGGYHSAPVQLLQNDYWDLYYLWTMLSKPLSGGEFTMGDVGGAQVWGGVLVGVVVTSGRYELNTDPGNVIALSVADNRQWITDTMANNPAPRFVIPDPTCPVWLCR